LITINRKLSTCISISHDGFAVAASADDGKFIAAADLKECDPSTIALSDFGFFVVGFNQGSCLLKVLDQNLVVITEKRVGWLVQAWKCLSWGDGVDYLIVVTKDSVLILLSLPFLEELVLPIEIDTVVAEIDFICNERILVLADADGRVYSITL
jgi:hypothetical protein